MKKYIDLETARSTDIRSVDKSTLTDITDIDINTSQPVKKRLQSFMEKTSNPYCVVINGFAVKFSFSDGSKTMYDRLKTAFVNSEI